MLCIWISDRLDVFSPPPADSLGYHSGFICRSARLCFMEAARTQRSIQTEWEREREREQKQDFPTNGNCLCVWWMFPDTIWLSMCTHACVYCDVYCIQVQDCVCARLHLQQYFNVVYDGNKRLQLCNGGKGGRMFLPSGVCFFLRLRAFH